eukprot:6210026-Pleurochrysis_carterae.AAC.1
MAQPTEGLTVQIVPVLLHPLLCLRRLNSPCPQLSLPEALAWLYPSAPASHRLEPHRLRVCVRVSLYLHLCVT